MLREVDCKEWQIILAKSLQEFLYNKGFRNVVEIRYNKDGKLYTIKQDKIYIEMEKIQGKEFPLDNEKNIKEFSRLLAAFHNAVEGYIAPPGVKINVKWGKQLEKYKKLCKALEKFKDNIKDKENLSEFEKTALPYLDDLLKRAKNSMKMLRTLKYLSFLEDSMKRREVCLNKISDKTVIKTKRGLYILEVFDAGYNMIEEDIAKLIRRGIEKTTKKSIFNEVIEEYSKVRELNSNSIDFIKAYVSFPYDSLKVISRYLKGKEFDFEKKFKKAIYKDDVCNLLEV